LCRKQAWGSMLRQCRVYEIILFKERQTVLIDCKLEINKYPLQ